MRIVLTIMLMHLQHFFKDVFRAVAMLDDSAWALL
jgi:hypothetical protein